MPTGSSVLVHGDIWQGNTMWIGDRLTAMRDWDAAGVGHRGIDLGSARLDAAIMFCPAATDDILHGWQQAAGTILDSQVVAYWDLRAALNTPSDMEKPTPNHHAQGRTDLCAATAAARRDDLVRSALANAGMSWTVHDHSCCSVGSPIGPINAARAVRKGIGLRYA
jgi:hypothetical protein